MKKYFTLLIILFITNGCVSNKVWNTPFINSKDIVGLEFGMSKSLVLDLMPEPPLYVKSGNSEISVWVYKVRTIKVKSATSTDGTITPRKSFNEIKHQDEIDDLFLTFDNNNKLLAWGNRPYNPNFVLPITDCAGVCNGEAYIDECGECIGLLEDSNDNSSEDDGGSFKLELNIEGTQEPDGSLIIKGGK